MSVGKKIAYFIANCDQGDYISVKVFLEFAITYLCDGLKFDQILYEEYDQKKLESHPLAKDLLNFFASNIRGFSSKQQLSMVIALDKDLEEISQRVDKKETFEQFSEIDFEVAQKFIDFAISWLVRGYKYEIMFNQKYEIEQREKAPKAKAVLTNLGERIKSLDPGEQLTVIMEFKEKLEKSVISKQKE